MTNLEDRDIAIPFSSKENEIGVPIVVQWAMNLTSNHEDAGSIPGLTQWVKEPVFPCAMV